LTIDSSSPTENLQPPVRWRHLWAMVLVALTLRLIVMIFLLPEQLDPARDHWKFGYETGRIARSIAEGRGFSSPLFADTGPTAWMTPVYPYFVAGIFRIFGIYTKTSALVLLSSNALFSALTCLPIFFIAVKSFGLRTARWSGWTWAFFPYAIYFPVERIWETWLATLLLAIVFWLCLRLADGVGTTAWIAYGLLWGIAALTSPSLLVVLPFLGCWVCVQLYKKQQNWFRPSLLAAIAFLLVVTPWFIRNYQVFHRFIPFRDNMGMVLRLGTKGSTSYWAPYELGPWHNQAEWQDFLQLGELAYMDKEKDQAITAIKADPGWYIRSSLRRALFLWTGYWSLDRDYLQQEPFDPYNIPLCTGLTVLALAGLWRAFKWRSAFVMPFALVLFTFPLIYYITSPEVYYRRPIDPIILVLAVYAVAGRERAGRESPAVVSGAPSLRVPAADSVTS
jgi:hypothetical protein